MIKKRFAVVLHNDSEHYALWIYSREQWEKVKPILSKYPRISAEGLRALGYDVREDKKA